MEQKLQRLEHRIKLYKVLLLNDAGYNFEIMANDPAYSTVRAPSGGALY
jgi:hypothetical protein